MDWLIAQLQSWGYWALFLLTFLETSALLGLLVPGETVVVVAGFLAAQGILDLGDALGIAAAGALAGDNTGYLLGRYFGDAVMRYAQRVFLPEEHLLRARLFIDQYGGKTIFFGRFVGWFRSFGPLVAGIAKLSYPRFLFFDLYGAVLWAATFTLLGYFAGSSWEIVKTYLGRAGIAIAALLALALFAWLFLRKRRRLLDRQLGRLDRKLSLLLPNVWAFAKDRFRPRGWYGLNLTIGFVLLVLALAALAGIVEDVIHLETLAALDLRARNLVESLLSPHVTQRLVTLTNVSAFFLLAASAAALLAYLSVRGDRLRVYAFLVAVGVGELVLVVLRAAFEEAELGNFPSGYAYSAMLIYGFAAYVAWSRLAGEVERFAAYSVAVALILLIGFAQIYLEVHWLTDILAGYVAAFAWLVFAILLVTATYETAKTPE